MVKHPSLFVLLQPKKKRQRREQQFDPITACPNAKLRSIKWVFLNGAPSSEEVTEPALLLGELDGVLDGDLRRVTNIPFRDPDSFKAGELHKHFNTWEAVLNGYEKGEEILQWIKEGVDITEFMRPFKGVFKSIKYDSDTPPPPDSDIWQSQILQGINRFISRTLEERPQTGAVRLWGKVGEVTPPRAVINRGTFETKVVH